MIIRLLIGCLCLGLFGFCPSPKSSKTNEKNGATSINKNMLKIIRYQNGETTEAKPLAQQAQQIQALALSLLANAEPMRLSLEDEQMQEIEHPKDGFEIQFLPPYSADTNAPALHKLLFLQSGKFATGKDATSNARFFVALADNYQYIRSPYILEQSGDKVAQLIHLINK
jgi:hypothetical protein